MVRVETVDEVFEGPPGAFLIKDASVNGELFKHIWCKLPSGGIGCLALSPAPPAAGPAWGFDGNMDKPTLTPSVHQIGDWHGFFRAGRMESC